MLLLIVKISSEVEFVFDYGNACDGSLPKQPDGIRL